MWGPRITLIYFYLISAISIVLLVIGTYNIVNFGINSLLYDKYPLNYGATADRCNFTDYGKPLAPYDSTAPVNGPVASISAEERADREARCLASLEEERRQHRVNDIKNTLAFTLIGAMLFALHFPSALKRANEDRKSNG